MKCGFCNNEGYPDYSSRSMGNTAVLLITCTKCKAILGAANKAD